MANEVLARLDRLCAQTSGYGRSLVGRDDRAYGRCTLEAAVEVTVG